MKDSKVIMFNGEEIEVKKIPLRRFGELAMAFDKLPETFQTLFDDGNLTEISTDVIIQKAPLILFNLNVQLVKFLSVASGIEEDKINEAGFDDAFTVIEAILEINNLDLIIAKIKNLRSLLGK